MKNKIRCDIKSLNYDKRAENTSIQFLILHFTQADLLSSLKLLTDRNSDSQVSIHYIVDREGEIYQLVDEEYRAWHAGKSSWQGLSDINSRSIGIEIINSGYGPDFQTYPRVQMDSVQDLAKNIISRYNIPPFFVLGHSDIAPDRKIDPGHFFDWKGLAKEGIGHYPFIFSHYKNTLRKDNRFQKSQSISKFLAIQGNISSVYDQNIVKKLQTSLIEYGYGLLTSEIFDQQTQQVLRAFQMHFYPQSYSLKELRESEGPRLIKDLKSPYINVCLARLKWLIVNAENAL